MWGRSGACDGEDMSFQRWTEVWVMRVSGNLSIKPSHMSCLILQSSRKCRTVLDRALDCLFAAFLPLLTALAKYAHPTTVEDLATGLPCYSTIAVLWSLSFNKAAPLDQCIKSLPRRRQSYLSCHEACPRGGDWAEQYALFHLSRSHWRHHRIFPTNAGFVES